MGEVVGSAPPPKVGRRIHSRSIMSTAPGDAGPHPDGGPLDPGEMPDVIVSTMSAGMSSRASSTFTGSSQDDHGRQSCVTRGVFRSEGGKTSTSSQSRGMLATDSGSFGRGRSAIRSPCISADADSQPSLGPTVSYTLEFPSELGIRPVVPTPSGEAYHSAGSHDVGSRPPPGRSRFLSEGGTSRCSGEGPPLQPDAPYGMDINSRSEGSGKDENSESVLSGSLKWQAHSAMRMDKGSTIRSRMSVTSRPSIGNVTIKPQLLRGVPASRTFVRFGRLWRRSPCDMPQEELKPLYQYSAPCVEIDTFISHAWGTPWWQKYLALLMHFYGRTAAYSGCWTLMWCCALDLAGLLPQAEVRLDSVFSGRDHPPVTLQFTPWSGAPILVSVITLILSPRLTGQQRDKNLFMDVVCINQIDDAEKAEGINHLAGFLNKSREMLVCWSPETLQRMWCVFELAIFSALHGTERKITWCPVFLHSLLLIQYLTVSLIFVANEIRHCVQVSDGSKEWFASNWFIAVYCVLIIPAIYLWDMGRSFMRQRHGFARTVEAFDIHEASCRDEGDRRYVLRNIRHWYGSEDIFNKEVQGPLAAQIAQAINSVDADYVTVLLASAPQFCYSLEYLVAYTRGSLAWQDLLMLSLLQLLSTFCLFPVWLKIGWHGMSVFRRSAGSAIRDLGFSAFLTLTWAATYAFLWTATRWFTQSLAHMLVCTFLWIIGTYLAFSSLLRRAWRTIDAYEPDEAMSPPSGRDLRPEDIKDRRVDSSSGDMKDSMPVSLFPDYTLSDKIIEERPSEVADRQSEANVWSERSTMSCMQSQSLVPCVRELYDDEASNGADEVILEQDEVATVYSV